MNAITLIKRLLGLEEITILERQTIDDSWDQLLTIQDSIGLYYAYFGDPITNRRQSLVVRNIHGKLFTFVKRKIRLISVKVFPIEPEQVIQIRNRVIKRALKNYFQNKYIWKQFQKDYNESAK